MILSNRLDALCARRLGPRRALSFAVGVAAAVTLAACAPAPAATDSSFVVADLFATPGKSLATLEPSPSAHPSPTVINVAPPTLAPTLSLPTFVALAPPQLQSPPSEGLLVTPLPTFTPIPSPPACPSEPPLPFGAIWQNAPQAKILLGCPTGSPQPVSGVWQAFERGAMFWRASDQSIFVISDTAIRQGKLTDSWWRLADTWREGEPDSDPSLTPPPGLIQPMRGFGKVWRSNGFIREAVGWAVGEESGIDSQWALFEGGWMMAGPNGTPTYPMIGDAGHSVGTHLAPAR